MKTNEFMQDVELKAGYLITFSAGEWRTYGYNGNYVALVDVSDSEMRELAEEVQREADRIENEEDRDADPHSMFLAAMIRNGWLAVLEMREIHIGSSGELDLS